MPTSRLLHAADSQSAPADASLVAAPGAGKAIHLFRVRISTDTAGRLQVTEGAAAAATRLIDEQVLANGAAVLDFRDSPYVLPANTALLFSGPALSTTRIVAFYQVGPA